jgi:hypothetical protein
MARRRIQQRRQQQASAPPRRSRHSSVGRGVAPSIHHPIHPPYTINTPSIHYPDAIHAQSAHYQYTIHLPSVHHPCTLRTPFKHHPYTIRTPFTRHPYTLRTPSIHHTIDRPYTIHTPSVHHPSPRPWGQTWRHAARVGEHSTKVRAGAVTAASPTRTQTLPTSQVSTPLAPPILCHSGDFLALRTCGGGRVSSSRLRWPGRANQEEHCSA